MSYQNFRLIHAELRLSPAAAALISARSAKQRIERPISG